MEQITETIAYLDRRMEIQKAINTDVSKGGDVYILNIDYKAFEKSDEEKALLFKLRHDWREEMRLKYPGWTKRQRN